MSGPNAKFNRYLTFNVAVFPERATFEPAPSRNNRRTERSARHHERVVRAAIVDADRSGARDDWVAHASLATGAPRSAARRGLRDINVVGERERNGDANAVGPANRLAQPRRMATTPSGGLLEAVG